MPTPSDQKPESAAALSRAFIFSFLARTYENPDRATWKGLAGLETRTAFASAVENLKGQEPAPSGPERELLERIAGGSFEDHESSHVTAFGHAVRGDCPMNEIEYGDIKADPLFQPHRLADIAAFYRAYGLDFGGEGRERQDHVSVELEFMSVLAAREAYGVEQGLSDLSAGARDGQKAFLRDHAGRWLPAFGRRVADRVPETVLGAAARFTAHYIAGDCRRFGVAPGSEDLLLRVVNPAEETLCGSCGLNSLLPGAGPNHGTQV